MQGIYGFRVTTDNPAAVLEALGNVFWSLSVPPETDPEIMFHPEQWVATAVRDPEQRALVEDGSIVTPSGTVVRVDGKPYGPVTVEIDFRRPSIRTAKQLLEALRDTMGFTGSIILMDRNRTMYEEFPGCGPVEHTPAMMFEAVRELFKQAMQESIDRYASWVFD